MRSIELFAGAGGLGLGVSRAGFVPAAVIEWDRYCCDTIRENQEKRLEPVAHWPLIEGDVRAINFKEIEGPIEFISGGPPCQPFSLGGKHRGQKDRRDMFGRSLPHLIETVSVLEKRGVGFRSVTEAIDTTTPGGRLVFHLFGALGQFERDLVRERTRAGLAAAEARGRKGGRNPVEEAKLGSARLYRRFQALEGLAEGDREAIIKVIDAMVIKHQTRQMVEEIGS